MSAEEKVIGRPSQRWNFLFAFAPFACVIGAVLLAFNDSTSQLGVSMRRADAVAIASEYAGQQGVDPSGWSNYVTYEADNAWRHYLSRHGRAIPAATRNLVAEVFARVVLEAPDESERFEALLTVTGRVAGFSRTMSAEARPADRGDEHALDTATRAFHTAVGGETAGFELTASERNVREEVVHRNYTWRRPLPASRAGIAVDVNLAGDALTRTKVRADIDQYRAETAVLNPMSGFIRGGVLFGAILLLLLYASVRLILRAREKEVPWKRVLLIALLVASGFAFFSILSDAPRVDETGQPRSGFMIIIAVTAAMFSLIVGIAWGASEGDVRERFSNKLTSFDALLGGAFRARVIWQSLLLGFAFSGYVILAHGVLAAVAALHESHFVFLQRDTISLLATRAPVLVLATSFTTGIPLLMVGLLLPVAIASRLFKRNILIHLTVFLAIYLFVVVSQAGLRSPGYILLISAAISAAAMIVPFWKGDLLAAIAVTAATSWVATAVQFLMQPASTLRTAAVVHLALLVALVVVAILGTMRGRELSARELVRPAYARNISERLALQADLYAAREAQLRLTPRAIPEMEGVGIAAENRPARDVSGDYFDFFSQGEGRVALVMADGEGLPLTCALAATLIKGMLVSYSRRGLEPRETLSNVQKHLGAIFGSILPFSLLYGELDARERTFHYGTLGAIGVLHIPAAGEATWDARVGLGEASRAVSRIRTSSVSLTSGDRIAVVSRGIAAAQNEWRERFGEEKIASFLQGRAPSGGPAEDLRRMFHALELHTRGVEVDDDWTAILIQVGDAAQIEKTERAGMIA